MNPIADVTKPTIEKKEIFDSKQLYHLLPKELSNLANSRHLFSQLEPVYNFLLHQSNKAKGMKEKINIISTFCDDISHQELVAWYLPRYKILLTLLSLPFPLNSKGNLLQLFKCIHLLIVSHSCFGDRQQKEYVKLINETLIYNIIKKNLLPNLGGKSKVYLSQTNRYLNENNLMGGNSKLQVDIKKLCKLHFRGIIRIINISIQRICTANPYEGSRIIDQTLICVDNICVLIESLAHILISVLNIKSVNENCDKAYQQFYWERAKRMPNRYYDEISSDLLLQTENREERIQFLKVTIYSLLNVINRIKWSLLLKYIKRYKYKNLHCIEKSKINIDCSLLATGDLDLITKSRLLNWPELYRHERELGGALK